MNSRSRGFNTLHTHANISLAKHYHVVMLWFTLPSIRRYYLPPTKEEVYAIARDVCLYVCMSVCLSVSKISLRLLKNACLDLDEILHVNRCRDVDELINF